MTIGAVFSPTHKLNNDYTVTTQVSTTNSNNLDATLELPNTFGVGFTYNYDKRLTVGADYSLQQWSKTKFGVNTSDDAVREDFNETYTYCNRHKVSVGAEYIPNLMGRSYLSHIKYRLGAYYTTPYYKIGGKEATREYGVTAGLITLEDIVEEIFGELRDEYDESEEDTFKELPDGSYMVSASLKLDDLDDLLDVDLDSEDYDSLGGYIIELLDHLPSEGETAEDEHFLFKVVSVDKNRMETIHIIPKEQ